MNARTVCGWRMHCPRLLSPIPHLNFVCICMSFQQWRVGRGVCLCNAYIYPGRWHAHGPAPYVPSVPRSLVGDWAGKFSAKQRSEEPHAIKIQRLGGMRRDSVRCCRRRRRHAMVANVSWPPGACMCAASFQSQIKPEGKGARCDHAVPLQTWLRDRTDAKGWDTAPII
jgi:hypothetical protein